MSNTFDCRKCGAGLSSAGAVNGFVKCEYCGAETRIAGPAPAPTDGRVGAPPPPAVPPPPRVMPGASGGGGSSWVVVAVVMVALLLVGAGVAVFFLSKGIRRHRGTVTWSTSAARYRSQVGKRFTFRCPPNGIARSVWGSGPYTDDSSVCTAAVHAGLIRRGPGGRVTVEIVAGQGRYKASERNGIRTSSYGSYPGSFVFPAAPPAAAAVAGAAKARPASGSPGGSRSIRANWATNPSAHRGRNGERFVYLCPPRGRRGSLWGSNPYTSDSSVCTAAVHAGVITFKGGGRVEIEMAPGRSRYAGSRRHGVNAGAWAAYPSSFKVLGSPPARPTPLPTPP